MQTEYGVSSGSIFIVHKTFNSEGGKKPKASVQTFAWAFHYKPAFLVGWKSFVRKFSGDLLNVTDKEEELVFL